jgi:hypothetical protein
MYTVSITEDDVVEALAVFLQPFCGASTIARTQVNRVAMPPSPCVMLTPILTVDLSTPIVTNDDVAETSDIRAPARIDVQIDFYGPTAADFCKATKGVWRTSYATDQFPSGIKPLYCDDGRNSPLVTGEEQYESRWTLTASMQYNPDVTVPQQSAEELAASVIQADS